MAIVDFLHLIKNDEEALAVLSAVGFSLKDWPFIKKIGSARKLLESDLMVKLLTERAIQNPQLSTGLERFKEGLEQFYRDDGFLITPLGELGTRLMKSSAAPLAFFGRYAQRLIDKKPAVAIVGARNASVSALSLTKNLASMLARSGINVVSGGAMGVDQAAHSAALQAGGTTIMVSGLVCDFFKSPDTIWSNEAFRAKYAAIYPFGPLIPQGKFMFVERNRFVAALADAVVIVQGKKGSGTLHTARFAQGLKVPLFAIPGAINDPLSYVPNHLLGLGVARALVDFEQFAQSLMTSVEKPSKHVLKKRKNTMEDSSENKELPYILHIIKRYDNGLSLEELLRITGYSLTNLQRELLGYELSGCLIKRGAQFMWSGN